jgi:ribosomal protein L11 methylase PrmA
METSALLAVSGFFESDLNDLTEVFTLHGLRLESYQTTDGWCCAVFRKETGI